MALMRLYWIPHGAKPERGGYVHYPFRELLAVLARESRRARCLVVGEDLGTVPRRAARGAATRRACCPTGRCCSRATYPRDALVCVSTHDLPTWRGFWAANDLQLRQGARPDRRLSSKELAQREGDKETLRARRAQIPTPARGARLHRAHAVQARDGAARGRVRARRAGEPAGHRRRAPELAAQAAARARALARGSARRRAARHHGASAASRRARLPGASPVATYRLQFHKGLPLQRREALVPYLAASASATSTPRRSSRRARAARTATTWSTTTRSIRRSAPRPS